MKIVVDQLREDDILVYVGSYTKRSDMGLHVYALDRHTGQLRHIQSVKENNASYLDVDQERGRLYSVSEIETDDGTEGAVAAFSIDLESGHIQLINRQPAVKGRPTYIKIDNSGRFVLVANYGGSNVSMYPIQEDGSLDEMTDLHFHEGSGVNKHRQDKAHPHCIIVDPDNRYAYVPDLGIDQIVRYRLEWDKKKFIPVVPVITPPGSGPRHMIFHPNGKFAYLINELDATVIAYKYDKNEGTLSEIQTLLSLPRNFKGENTSADIHITPDGRFLYVSNRGHDSLTAFSINEETGLLTVIGHTPSGGRTPRNFAITPNGNYLLAANQDTDNIVVFHIDQETGELTATGHEIEVPEAVCIKMIAR